MILEAQASGLPVVAVAAGGPAELVADGRSGVLCPPRVDELASALASLAGSRAARERLARGGLAAVAGRSWEASLGRLAARLAPDAQLCTDDHGRRSARVIEAGPCARLACVPRRAARRRRAVRRRHRRRRNGRARHAVRARAAARGARRRPAPDRGGRPLALVLGTIRVTADEVTAQDLTRLATVALGSAVAVWVAALRERAAVDRGAARRVFEHAPVGLATARHARAVRARQRQAGGDQRRAGRRARRPHGRRAAARPARRRAGGRRARRPHRRAAERRPRQRRHARAPGRRARVHGVVLARPPGRRRRADRRRDRRDRGHRAARRRPRAARRRPTATRRCCSRSPRPARAWWCSSATGVCVFANAAFEQLCGYTFPELAAMDSVFDLVVEYEDEEIRRRALRALEGGPVRPGRKRTLRRRDGALVDIELGAVPLEVDDRRQLVVVVRDVTARRQAEVERERLLARSALLAEASELFDQSLDEQETMRSVARLCVRATADTCVILLGDERAGLRRVAAAAGDEARERELLAALDDRVRGPDAGGDAQRRGARGERRRDRPAGGARARARRAGRRRSTGSRPATRTICSRCSRTSRGARRSRSTARACTRSATTSPARSSGRCSPPSCPTSRASRSPPATWPRATATRSAATSTTASRPAPATGRW